MKNFVKPPRTQPSPATSPCGGSCDGIVSSSELAPTLTAGIAVGHWIRKGSKNAGDAYKNLGNRYLAPGILYPAWGSVLGVWHLNYLTYIT